MNRKLLKDRKIVIGLVTSIIFSIIAIVLAVYEISLWVFFLVLALIASFFSANRAGKVTRD